MNLRGGDAYPSLIRKTERKPLRVFLQDSGGDLDNAFGHWPTANKNLHAALRYMGYDCRFDFVEGYGHNAQHGGSIFPDALRWLWRHEKSVPSIVTKGDLAGDLTLHRLLIEGEGWQPVVDGLGNSDAACSDGAGNFYFTDIKNPGIFKVTADGTKTRLSTETASGLKFGPDGKLYGCLGAKNVSSPSTPRPAPSKSSSKTCNPTTSLSPAAATSFYRDPKEAGHVLRPRHEDQAHRRHRSRQPQRHHPLAGRRHTLRQRARRRICLDLPRRRRRHARREDAHHDDAPARRSEGRVQTQQSPPYVTAARGDGMTTDTLGRTYVTTALGVKSSIPRAASAA